MRRGAVTHPHPIDLFDYTTEGYFRSTSLIGSLCCVIPVLAVSHADEGLRREIDNAAD